MGAKGLLQIVKHIDKSFANINSFATLSPIPTLSSKFPADTESSVINEWLSQRKDPVARFHLRNGAKILHVNKNADKSNLRMKQSHGIMVNYQYHL